MNYFFLTFREDAQLGIARSRSDELFFLPQRGSVLGWDGHDLDLEQGSFLDYLANDLGCRLCSDALRDLLNSYASKADMIQWLSTVVYCGAESKRYSILHFPDPPDVLSDSSVAVGDMVVKPILSAKKAMGHSVFAFVGAEGLSLIVDQQTRNALQESRLSGVEAELVPLKS